MWLCVISYFLSGIPYKKNGKLIVAVDESELDGLDDLHERAKLNNVPDLVMLDSKQIEALAPACKVRVSGTSHVGH